MKFSLLVVINLAVIVCIESPSLALSVSRIEPCHGLDEKFTEYFNQCFIHIARSEKKNITHAVDAQPYLCLLTWNALFQCCRKTSTPMCITVINNTPGSHMCPIDYVATTNGEYSVTIRTVSQLLSNQTFCSSLCTYSEENNKECILLDQVNSVLKQLDRAIQKPVLTYEHPKIANYKKNDETNITMKNNAAEENKKIKELAKSTGPHNLRSEGGVQDSENYETQHTAEISIGGKSSLATNNPENSVPNSITEQCTTNCSGTVKNEEPRTPQMHTVKNNFDSKITPSGNNSAHDSVKQMTDSKSNNGTNAEEKFIDDNLGMSKPEKSVTTKHITDIKSEIMTSKFSEANLDSYNKETDDDDVIDEDIASPGGRSEERQQTLSKDESQLPYTSNVYNGDNFFQTEDSHFSAYFLMTVSIIIIGYVIYHNKNKIVAYALEGKRDRGGRRRPSSASYRKLDSNLEEAIASNPSNRSVTNVVY